jgi:hypothetical protein
MLHAAHPSSIDPTWQAQQAHLEGAELPQHLLLQAWTPQTAVLGHPAVKAFITHGGMNRCVHCQGHTCSTLELRVQVVLSACVYPWHV